MRRARARCVVCRQFYSIPPPYALHPPTYTTDYSVSSYHATARYPTTLTVRRFYSTGSILPRCSPLSRHAHACCSMRTHHHVRAAAPHACAPPLPALRCLYATTCHAIYLCHHIPLCITAAHTAAVYIAIVAYVAGSAPRLAWIAVSIWRARAQRAARAVCRAARARARRAHNNATT